MRVQTAVDSARRVFVLGYHLSRAIETYPDRLHRAANAIFGLYDAGALEFVIGEQFDLSEAATAHRYIENRESRGKVVLVP